MKFGLITLLTAFTLLISNSLSEIISLNDLNFDKAVQEGEWILDFYAEWCGHCKRFASVYEEIDNLAEENSIDINLAKINIDENPQLASRFYITSLPTFIHLKGKEVRKFNIERTPEAFIKFITQKEWEEIKPRGFISSPFSIIGRWVGYVSVIGAFLSRLGKWISQYVNLWALFGATTVFMTFGTIYFLKKTMPNQLKDKSKKRTKKNNSKVKVDIKENTENDKDEVKTEKKDDTKSKKINKKKINKKKIN